MKGVCRESQLDELFMKKLIAILTAAVLLTISFCSTLVSAESTEISTLRPFASVNADGSFKAHVQVGGSSSAGDFSVTAVDNFTSVTTEKIIKVDSATGTAITENTPDNGKLNISFGGWDFANDWMFPMAGTDGIVFYVKMPKAEADGYAHFYTNLTVAWGPDKADSGKTWPQLVANAPYYLLAKGSTDWTTCNAAGGLDVALPGGFEGYIRFPWSAFGLNENDVQSAYMYEMNARFGAFGGDYGAAYIGNFFVATNAVMSKNAAIIGDSTEVVDLFTGGPVTEEEPKEDEDKDEPQGPSLDTTNLSTAVQLSYFKNYTLGGVFTGDATIHIEGAGWTADQSKYAFKAVESLTAVSDYPMLEWNTAAGKGAVTNNLVAETEVTATIRDDDYNWNYSLKDTNAFMFYVKAPKAVGGVSHLWMNICYNNSTKWSSLKSGKEYFTLKKGEKSWKNASVSADQDLSLTGEFEGWVRIPWTSFEADLSNATLTNVRMQFRDFGGDYGAGYVGAFMVATNSVMSYDGVVVDARNKIQNLFTAADMTEDDLKADDIPTVDLSDVAAADQLWYAESYTTSGAPFDDEADNTIAVDNVADVDVAFSLIASPNGVNEYPMIVWDVPEDAAAITGNALAKTSITMSVTGRNWDWKYDLTGANAIMFYVKAPKAASDGKARLWMALSIENKLWPQIKAGSAIPTLAKGETKWKNIKAEVSGELPFADGFEGWVRVPLTAFNQDISTRSLSNIRFQWLDFGAEYGPAALGCFMVATNKNISKDGIIIDSHDMIQNLFTGEEMTPEQVEPDAETRTVGEVYDALPYVTAEQKVNDIAESDITSSSVSVSWEAFTGAVNYRVEVFEPCYSETGVEFKYIQRVITDDTSAKITGLSADMRYYVVVCALGADGREIGVYDSASFFTNPASIGNDGQGGGIGNGGTSDTPTDTDTPEFPGIITSPITGYGFSVLAVMILVGSLAAIMSLRSTGKNNKRKGENA